MNEFAPKTGGSDQGTPEEMEIKKKIEEMLTNAKPKVLHAVESIAWSPGICAEYAQQTVLNTMYYDDDLPIQELTYASLADAICEVLENITSHTNVRDGGAFKEFAENLEKLSSAIRRDVGALDTQ